MKLISKSLYFLNPAGNRNCYVYRYVLAYAAFAILVLATIAPVSAQNSSKRKTDNEAVESARRDTDFYLAKATARLELLEAFVGSARQQPNQDWVPYREVLASRRDLKQISHQLSLVRDCLKSFPVQSKDYQTFARRHDRLADRLKLASEYLLPLRLHLDAILDPQNFPELKSDARRLKEIAASLENTNVFLSDPIFAATLYSNLENYQAEASRVVLKYNFLIAQQTIAGGQLAGLKKYFDSKSESFQAASNLQQETLPRKLAIQIELLEANLNSASESGIDFEIANSIPKQIDQIESQMSLLRVLKPSRNRSIEVKMRSFVDKTTNIEKTKSLSWPSQDLPPDRYNKPDRSDLTQALLHEIVAEDKTNVSAIRLPEDKWNRRSFWQLVNGKWVKTDRSTLPALALLATESNTQGYKLIRIEISKDHLNQDALSFSRTPFVWDSAFRYATSD